TNTRGRRVYVPVGYDIRVSRDPCPTSNPIGRRETTISVDQYRCVRISLEHLHGNAHRARDGPACPSDGYLKVFFRTGRKGSDGCQDGRGGATVGQANTRRV